MELDIMKKKKMMKNLEAGGFNVVRDTLIANDTGWRLDLDGGAIVNLFDSGSIDVQGRNPEQIQAVKEYLGKASVSPPATARQIILV
jgi:hypothetical protein